jgi:hypothetical protein
MFLLQLLVFLLLLHNLSFSLLFQFAEVLLKDFHLPLQLRFFFALKDPTLAVVVTLTTKSFLQVIFTHSKILSDIV